MAGWEQLGEVLGGGIDRQGAFQTGMLRSAQTENALGMARQRQLENIALETKNREREKTRETLAASGMDPAQADLLANVMLGEMGSDFKAGTEGMGELQTQNFRSTLADPNAPLGDQFAAGQGLQERVLPRYAITGTTAEDLFNRDAPLAPTPVGEAQIGLAQARAADPDLSQWGSPNSGPGGFGKEPPKYKLNPDFDPSRPPGPDNLEVIPLTGGAADVNSPRPLGVNALTQFARVLNAAGNTALDLTTIVSMPSGASMGVFGNPGKGLLSMIPANLANQVSPAEVQQYRAVMGTLGEQLSTIERTGMRGSQGLAERFNDLALLPTDDVFTKMLKLAQMRQTVENGMDTLASLNALPDSMLARTEELKNRVASAIPFTPRDVLMLQQSKDPNLTMGDLLARNGVNMSGAPAGAQPATPGGAAPPAPPAGAAKPGANFPMTNAKGWRKMKDAQGNYAYVGPNGEVEEISSGF